MNGALTGAYVAMYNHMQHGKDGDKGTPSSNRQQELDNMKQDFADFKYMNKIKKIKYDPMLQDYGSNFKGIFSKKHIITIGEAAFEEGCRALFFTIGHEMVEIGLKESGYNGHRKIHNGAVDWEQCNGSDYNERYNIDYDSYKMEEAWQGFSLPTNPYNP